MEKPNVRFHDGQILSEEPLNKAMEAVDYAVEEANKVPSAVSAATAASDSAAATAAHAGAIMNALNEIKDSGDIPAATISQVAENTADIKTINKAIKDENIIKFSECHVVQDRAVMNIDGNITTSGNHRVVRVDISDVDKFTVQCSARAAAPIFVLKDNTTGQYINLGITEIGETTYDVSMYKDTHTMYANWYNANASEKSYVNEIVTNHEGLLKRVGTLETGLDDLEEYVRGKETPIEPSVQGYINAITGALEASSSPNWKATNYIDASDFNSIKYHFFADNTAGIAAYSASKTFLPESSIVCTGDNMGEKEGEYVVDRKKVKYIRVCCWLGSGSVPNTYFKAVTGGISSQDNDDDIRRYKTMVRKPFAFSGKKAAFVGDSITWGYVVPSDSVHNTADYPKLFCESTGILWDEYTNIGVNGATFTPGQTDHNGNSVYDFQNTIQNVRKPVDFLFIAGGVNDYACGVQITTFRNALRSLCEYIDSNFSESTKVIWITPIEQDYLNKSRVILPLQEYRNAITEVVMTHDTYNRFSVVQGTDFNFPVVGDSEEMWDAMFADRLHPTKLGYKIYAASLQNALC